RPLTVANPQIYREESLERARSPEELDRLLVVVDRKAWLSLLVLGGLCLAALLWSIFGRIPITVNGFGVLINPGNVKGIQSQANGQIVEILVREGSHVAAGDILATINQPTLKKDLEQKREKRAQLVVFHAHAVELDNKRRDLELAAMADERKFITTEIAKSESLAQTLKEQTDAYSRRQRESLIKTQALRKQLAESLASRMKTIRQLRSEGLVSQESVLNSENQLAESQTRLSDLENELRQLDVQVIRNDQSHLEQQNRLSDLRLKLLQLDISRQRLLQELSANEQNRQNERQDLDDTIERLELSIQEESRIVSRESGRILEITVAAGQVVTSGARIGTLEIDDPDGKLQAVAYFNVADGKRVKQGDAARVTPSTVKRERFGSIVGNVGAVSSFPITTEGAVNLVGNDQIAQALMEQGGAIEIMIDLESDSNSASGYRWTSQGPPLRFSPGTTATVRILIEERSPISYVLPILRTWVFGEKDDREPTL
ncbi:MAG: NHLP bacteriocin system secretion protein, partial [Planctomycetales bacterium]|nr:NHLP bacteriocin system secretion protein [Planctomycetales bacterium]